MRSYRGSKRPRQGTMGHGQPVMADSPTNFNRSNLNDTSPQKKSLVSFVPNLIFVLISLLSIRVRVITIKINHFVPSAFPIPSNTIMSFFVRRSPLQMSIVSTTYVPRASVFRICLVRSSDDTETKILYTAGRHNSSQPEILLEIEVSRALLGYTLAVKI
jgi:hypothetical protein